MDELGRARDLRHGREALLEPVHDRLDVVIGLLLDRLDALGVGNGEVLASRGEQRPRRCGERRYLGHAAFVRERLEPGELDAHAMPDQAVLAEMLREPGQLVAVAPVQRAERREHGKRKRRVGVRHEVARGASGV